MTVLSFNKIKITVLVAISILIGFGVYKYIRYYPFKVAMRPETDETHCKYVSTFGLKKMCLQTKNCYFVSTTDLASFKVPEHNFVLVTNYSDSTVPDDFPDKSKEILSSPYLVNWYAANLTQEQDKLKHLPIGLDYHVVIQKPKMKVGPVESPVKQEEFIHNLSRKPFYERELKIYGNFIHAIRGRYGLKDRATAISQVPDELMVYEGNFVPREKSWANMSQYAFVLSPLGNGLDCHRTWEALVLGAIPIVKSGPLDPLYADLPVLIVKEWSDITPELLQATVNDFKRRQFNQERLTLSYWAAKFSS